MRVGDVELYIVSDGATRMDGGGVFGLVPRVLWEKISAPDDKNRVPTALNNLLILSKGKKILVDTGLGEKLSPKQEENFARVGGSQLVANLNRLGYSPHDIDIVVNTHLHADHCGGNTCRVGDELVATFPRAEYWMQMREVTDALFPNERTQATYYADNFQPILRDRVHLMDGDTPVTEEVNCVVTRGHTYAHQSVIIESRGERAIFLADLAGRVIYMERIAWIPAYDLEPLESLKTKRFIRDWAVHHNALLIFQHDPNIAFARLHADGDRFRAEPVIE